MRTRLAPDIAGDLDQDKETQWTSQAVGYTLSKAAPFCYSVANTEWQRAEKLPIPGRCFLCFFTKGVADCLIDRAKHASP